MSKLEYFGGLHFEKWINPIYNEFPDIQLHIHCTCYTTYSCMYSVYEASYTLYLLHYI